MGQYARASSVHIRVRVFFLFQFAGVAVLRADIDVHHHM
jgi:hypothetical protein